METPSLFIDYGENRVYFQFRHLRSMAHIPNGKHIHISKILNLYILLNSIMLNYVIFLTEIVFLTEENCKLRDQVTCKRCMRKNVSSVFDPCGHILYCSDCAPDFKSCPICLEEVKNVIRVNLE